LSVSHEEVGNIITYPDVVDVSYDWKQSQNIASDAADDCDYVHFLDGEAQLEQSLRWQQHQDYELHLITETSGRAFIGDYIGQFRPGNLVLIGPYLPYKWIAKEFPEGQAKVVDKVLLFTDKPLRRTSLIFPELHELMPLLERAKYGIEFQRISRDVEESLDKIREMSGVERLSVFLQLLHRLSSHQHYRLLSSAHYQRLKSGSQVHKVEKAIGYIALNYDNPLTMKQVAEYAGMTANSFSRDFRRATGKTFTDYMNHLRVRYACELLMSTEHYISTICYKVGFNNVANFNRRFLEIKGVTPSEFRRKRLLHSDSTSFVTK